MKSLVLFAMAALLVLQVSCQRTVQQTDKIRSRLLPALSREEIRDDRGQYALRYVTAEGTVVSERGRLLPNKDNTDYVLTIDGEYTYLGDDGKTYVTKYSSGLDGFKADAEHLPKSPNEV